MRTSKPISTITYNSPAFLEYILNNMIDNNIIVFYAFIEHMPESSETKKHIHLYIEPSERVDTSAIRVKFDEPCIESEDKLLGCMPFRTSKWDDWYLYSIHDIDYLRSKGLQREFIYDRSNIVTSDINYMLELINTISYNYGLVGKLIEAYNNKLNLKDLILNGTIKCNNVYQAERIYDILAGKRTNNRK